MIQPLNRRRFSAGLALAPWAAGGLLTGCSNIPDSIKIGVAQPLSGPLSALGKDLLNGVQLAVNELNKANFSIEGKRVTLEVMSVDDKADAATGKAVAQQLVDAGVVAVVGHLNSGVSIETAPIYAAAGIAQIAISTNPKFTQLGHETTFRMVANDNLQARAIGSFASSQFGDVRFAALDDGTPYGKGLTDGAVEQLKAEKREVVLRQSFDDKTVAFDELAAKIKSEKVGVIVSTLNDFQAVALIAALAKIDYTNVRLLGGDTVKTTDMVKAAGQIQGIFATSPVLEAKEFVAGRPFLERYLEAFKVPPAYGGHYSYDSTYVLTAAMQAAKSVKPKDVTAALRRINGYAPVTGTMKWDEKGEQRYAAVGVYELRRGSWELRMRSDRW
ncbi:ABC transporter substrate-binding protein [Acidovorax sp. 210-6]|jgi:branched-chain amino acid transport system substrate-binding protein|uniref:branched-chain amino acid ABC transporter substrate-binding protein n=1 Tax=Comamonadaceae TaxID=80864 RepID=UPI001389B2AB|nr:MULTISPECIES: branched-chain amino acid ABC transporter substrate-binding protein [unclassified Acidovorax]NCU65285.1 ABC transporter substrate-binding protein [Acidovorax sp. 210-6]